jgi:hypothetical protein
MRAADNRAAELRRPTGRSPRKESPAASAGLFCLTGKCTSHEFVVKRTSSLKRECWITAALAPARETRIGGVRCVREHSVGLHKKLLSSRKTSLIGHKFHHTGTAKASGASFTSRAGRSWRVPSREMRTALLLVQGSLFPLCHYSLRQLNCPFGRAEVSWKSNRYTFNFGS